MATRGDHASEITSNLRRKRKPRGATEIDASSAEPPLDDGRRRFPCVDPDPTENVACRAPESPPAQSPPVDAGAYRDAADAGDGLVLSPADAAARDADEYGLPTILDSHLRSVRQFVAGDVVADRYLVVDGLPVSGMGEVYKALDRQRDSSGEKWSHVAIKFGRQADDEARRTPSLIQREFDVLSQLSHPNIVKVLDIGTHNHQEFLVMEWLEGRSLLQVLDDQTCRRMALKRARAIIRDVTSALACAHEKGIVHGDVKPSNIFVTSRGTAKLLDFGATSSDDDAPDEELWATRAYASPDVLDGKPAAPVDDVFSLGVTAYLLLTGEKPFGDRDAVEARRESSEIKPLPQDAMDHWPAIRAALRLDSADRPADAARFLAQFLRLSPAMTEIRNHLRPSLKQVGVLSACAMILAVLWSLRLHDVSAVDEQATLANAEAALVAGRLTDPAVDDALAYFSGVLAEHPTDEAARQGIDTLAGEMLSNAADSLSLDRLDAARASLSLAMELSPQHPQLPMVTAQFDRYASDLVARANLVAEDSPVEAARMLELAESLTSAETARIAEIRARMDGTAAEEVFEALIVGIDERILSERLAVPRGDSAIDLLTQARELRPDDDRLALAGNRIVSALLFQALFAISDGKLDKAEGFIRAARSLDVRHLATARTEYELAKARDRVAGQTYERVMQDAEQNASDQNETPGSGETVTE